MSFHIKDDFNAGGPVSQVPASWFNAVASFINQLVGGFGITIDKSESGKSEVAINRDVLQSELDNAVEGLREKPSTEQTDLASGATSYLDGPAHEGDDKFEAGKGKSCKVYILCHSHTNADATATLSFRPAVVSASGRVMSIGEESGTLTVYVASA